MNDELNKKINDAVSGEEMSDDAMENISGGAGQNTIVCSGCGRRFAITHHPTCPYCGTRPVLYTGN